jgi:hypothetical protein
MVQICLKNFRKEADQAGARQKNWMDGIQDVMAANGEEEDNNILDKDEFRLGNGRCQLR